MPEPHGHGSENGEMSSFSTEGIDAADERLDFDVAWEVAHAGKSGHDYAYKYKLNLMQAKALEEHLIV